MAVFPVERSPLRPLDRRAAVDRIAQRVDDAADHGIADRHRHHLAGALDGVALLDLLPLAEQHRGDVVLLEVQRQPGHAVGQLQLLQGDAAHQPVDAGDAVADLDDGADLFDVDVDLIALDLRLEDRGDLIWT